MKPVILTILLLVFISCTKRSVEEELKPATANITFLAPTPNQEFKKGDSILIQAIVTSTSTLHGYELVIRRVSQPDYLDFLHFHEHKDTLQINYKWKDTVTGTAALEAELTVFLDDDGHQQKAKIAFTSK